MKLATGSKQRITLFENAALQQLQTSSLSLKLSVCDDIVNECLYICNQNFDQRVHVLCVAVSDENWILWNFYDKEHDYTDISKWILWNFYDKERDYTDISKQNLKFHDVHHVQVKTLLEQQFLKCDYLLYER